MQVKDVVLRNRSYRRFDEHVPISTDTLRELVDLARLSPSGANRQPLKYILSNEPVRNARIFPALRWAGYLKDWPGPSEGERPSAYIIILEDTEISSHVRCEQGIAAQSILLGATEKGLGGCIFGSIQRRMLRDVLHIAERYEILLVIALGLPVETVVIDPLPADGNTKYWRDEQSVHHVPKRSLDEIIIA